MPYKYIGRTTDFRGKTLWEILGNLKNFGAGRIVARNRFQRYTEPCYMKVLKVEVLPNPKVPSYDDQRKAIVLCEKVFRGIKQEKLVQLESASYKADYFLVPKHQEKEFCKTEKIKEVKILANKMELPPFVREHTMRQMKASGIPITEEPKMKMKYNMTGFKMYRVAEEGETPTEPEPSLAYGTPLAPRLFENIEKC